MVITLNEIAKMEPVVAMQMKLQATFGLRVEESFLLRPAESIRQDGLLNVTRGTKGSRARIVSIELQQSVEKAEIKRHRKAMYQIVAAAGHSRPRKANAYLSSYNSCCAREVRRN